MEERENMTENTVELQDAARESAAHAAKIRKRIIIVFAIMLAFALLYFVVSYIVASIQEKDEDDGGYRPNTIIFHKIDYEYDILKDKDYLALDRRPYLSDASTGVTVSVSEKDLATQDEGFKLLYEMIQCIIRGDHEGYNALFSENYYSVEENAPEDEFTMQQIYDIKFTRIKVSEHTEGEIHYTQYEYEVEYKIRKNNGTFRTDIGSDASRTQYFVMSDSTVINGEQTVLIDRILKYNVKQ